MLIQYGYSQFGFHELYVSRFYVNLYTFHLIFVLIYIFQHYFSDISIVVCWNSVITWRSLARQCNFKHLPSWSECRSLFLCFIMLKIFSLVNLHLYVAVWSGPIPLAIYATQKNYHESCIFFKLYISIALPAIMTFTFCFAHVLLSIGCIWWFWELNDFNKSGYISYSCCSCSTYYLWEQPRTLLTSISDIFLPFVRKSLFLFFEKQDFQHVLLFSFLPVIPGS